MTETENKQSNKLIDWINGDYAPAESGMITAPEDRPRARVKNRVPVDDGAVKIIRMRRLGRYLGRGRYTADDDRDAAGGNGAAAVRRCFFSGSE